MKNIIIGAFLFHFSLVTISVLENIKVASPEWTYGVAKAYSHPFFEQNWGMFSNPPKYTRKIYFQFHQASPNHQDTLVSEWYDVNQAIYDFNDTHLFSIAQRLIKYESGCLNNIFQVIATCQDSSQIDDCIHYSAGYFALHNLAKITYKNSLKHTSTQNIAFKIKVVEESYLPFEDRHLDFFDKSNRNYSVLTTKKYPLRFDAI